MWVNVNKNKVHHEHRYCKTSLDKFRYMFQKNIVFLEEENYYKISFWQNLYFMRKIFFNYLKLLKKAKIFQLIMATLD